MMLAQAEKLPKVPEIQSDAWWWQWVAFVGLNGLVLAISFKNPKRSHKA